MVQDPAFVARVQIVFVCMCLHVGHARILTVNLVYYFLSLRRNCKVLSAVLSFTFTSLTSLALLLWLKLKKWMRKNVCPSMYRCSCSKFSVSSVCNEYLQTINTDPSDTPVLDIQAKQTGFWVYFFWVLFCFVFGFQNESKWCVFVRWNNVRRGNITLPHYRKALVQLDQACRVCHSPIIKFWCSNNKWHWISRPQESPSSPVLLGIIVSNSGREALNLSSTHSERDQSRTSQDASRPCKWHTMPVLRM